MSRRQGDALKAEHALLPAVHAASRIAEIMPWGGTSTASLLKRLPAATSLSVTELSQHNISFISERLVQEGHAPERVTYMLMRGGILPYDTASLDLVILPQVIEHMPDPQAMLNEARRVLAPGGHLLISTRNIDSAYGEMWQTLESRGQVPNQGPFTPCPAIEVSAWLSSRFDIEEEIGIGIEATGDTSVLRDELRFGCRLYAARGRRDRT